MISDKQQITNAKYQTIPNKQTQNSKKTGFGHSNIVI